MGLLSKSRLGAYLMKYGEVESAVIRWRRRTKIAVSCVGQSRIGNAVSQREHEVEPLTIPMGKRQPTLAGIEHGHEIRTPSSSEFQSDRRSTPLGSQPSMIVIS